MCHILSVRTGSSSSLSSSPDFLLDDLVEDGSGLLFSSRASKRMPVMKSTPSTGIGALVEVVGGCCLDLIDSSLLLSLSFSLSVLLLETEGMVLVAGLVSTSLWSVVMVSYRKGRRVTMVTRSLSHALMVKSAVWFVIQSVP